MMGSAATAKAVADRLAGVDVSIVFDPVMVASSGATLADDATIASFDRLLKLATLTTPNLPEYEALLAHHALPGLILVKGGHTMGREITDRLIDRAHELQRWTDTRIATTSTHGTGCTLASAIAVGLAQQMSVIEAVARARWFVRAALAQAPELGEGHGPMGHQAVRL